ncbi:MAG: sigma-70 family RNA polymerase sigma factor [Phycisphaerales bacterium]|nr:sigma-70 family RNA polymerase sigma factor [Phycisphaerales bacterium]
MGDESSNQHSEKLSHPKVLNDIPNNNVRTDPALIEAIRNPANYEAWKSFERRYAPMVRSYCVKRGMRITDAEDVAQEVFLRITEHGFADRYDPAVGTFRSYLFRVTRSVASVVIRTVSEATEIQSEIDYSEEEWNQVWKQEAVRLAIKSVEESVTGSSKRILSLTLRDVPPATIAELTGLTRDAVYKTRDRLKTRIESACKEFMLDPGEI